jgi:hypothetical protein
VGCFELLTRLAVLMWPVIITAVIVVPLLIVAFVRVRSR